jgi:hypothetical protein
MKKLIKGTKEFEHESSNNRQYAKFLIARETTTKIFISNSEFM